MRILRHADDISLPHTRLYDCITTYQRLPWIHLSILRRSLSGNGSSALGSFITTIFHIYLFHNSKVRQRSLRTHNGFFFPGVIRIIIATAKTLATLTRPVLDVVAPFIIVLTQNIFRGFAGLLAVAIRSVDVWLAEEAVPIALAAQQSIANVAEQVVEKCKQMMVDYIKHETSLT